MGPGTVPVNLAPEVSAPAVVMSRGAFPQVAAPPAAGLVALLLVAAAAGGVRGSGGDAALPRKLAAGGSGNKAAELVKDSPRASAEGEKLVVKDSAPSFRQWRR
ncbi:unnamed protein product, partial [Closterium sp. Yama58-4]